MLLTEKPKEDLVHEPKGFCISPHPAPADHGGIFYLSKNSSNTRTANMRYNFKNRKNTDFTDKGEPERTKNS